MFGDWSIDILAFIAAALFAAIGYSFKAFGYDADCKNAFDLIRKLFRR